uniref:Secreted protein n=1 Tax=Arundo donax TaxID=35708 RepID=A0A0A9CGV5_ARUDO
MKGPVFLAMWNPLSLLLTVLCSSLLGEAVHLGRCIYYQPFFLFFPSVAQIKWQQKHSLSLSLSLSLFTFLLQYFGWDSAARRPL